MKNASLKAFQMTNLVQQQRGPALALGFARICTNPPMNSEFEMKQGQISFQHFLLWKNTCWLIHVVPSSL